MSKESSQKYCRDEGDTIEHIYYQGDRIPDALFY